MKRLLLPIVLLVVATGQLLAQEEVSGPIGFGVKGGFNIANLSGDDAEMIGVPPYDITEATGEKKMSLGFSFGGFLTYRLSPVITIQSEVLYAIKGAKYEGTYVHYLGDTIDYASTIKLVYIQIPVLVKFTVPTQSSLHPFLYAGPSPGILVSAKYETGNESVDVKDDMKSIDFGGILGAGVDFPVGSGRLGIEARYDLGLTNIVDVEGVGVKTTTISALVSYSVK